MGNMKTHKAQIDVNPKKRQIESSDSDQGCSSGYSLRKINKTTDDSDRQKDIFDNEKNLTCEYCKASINDLGRHFSRSKSCKLKSKNSNKSDTNTICYGLYPPKKKTIIKGPAQQTNTGNEGPIPSNSYSLRKRTKISHDTDVDQSKESKDNKQQQSEEIGAPSQETLDTKTKVTCKNCGGSFKSLLAHLGQDKKNKRKDKYTTEEIEAYKSAKQKEKYRKYREKKKDEISEKKHEYYEKNKDKISELYEKNKDKISEQRHEFYEKKR